MVVSMEDGFQLRKLVEVRRYQGKFTGKVVKPIDDEDNMEKLKDFKKGDLVLVFNVSDFKDFLLTLDKVKDTYSPMTELIKIQQKLIKLYKERTKDYNKQLLWLFKVLKEAQIARIRFDDPNFVDDNIKELEHKIYFSD